jgi:two-component system sensor histidine kinase AlgZ
VVLTPPHTLLFDTLRALGQPRRVLAIVAVGGSLIAAQLRFDPYVPRAFAAIGLLISFLLIAPASYRYLVLERPGSRGGVLLYIGLCAAMVMLFGRAVPYLARQTLSFLTSGPSLTVCFALFVVGGWGLGRDIHLEQVLLRTQKRAAALQREAEQAQLLALRSHFDPHFLFNTLNAIAEWCREDGEVAERAVLQLASMLRTVLSGVRAAAWPLSRELELCAMLFELHLFRDPQLFQLHQQHVSPLPDVEVPPMILLPLAENAVKHGPAAGHRGRLDFAVSVENQLLKITLENPGPYRGPRPGSDGLPTVQRRLELAYAGRARLRIFGAFGGAFERTRVELELPLIKPAGEIAV